MTPAIRVLIKKNIPYKLHSYHHNPNETHFGDETVLQLALDSHQVYKTLVVSVNNDTKYLVVAVVPVAKKLDLKKLAKIINAKKTELADPLLAQKITGYLIGGISPIGQKKALPTYIDASVNHYSTLYISGGKRGLNIEIAPQALIDLTAGRIVEITIND